MSCLSNATPITFFSPSKEIVCSIKNGPHLKKINFFFSLYFLLFFPDLNLLDSSPGPGPSLSKVSLLFSLKSSPSLTDKPRPTLLKTLPLSFELDHKHDESLVHFFGSVMGYVGFEFNLDHLYSSCIWFWSLSI